jgi:hypothetical protein
MECVPVDSEAVPNEASPELLRVVVLSVVDPSLNVTLPVGMPKAAVTLAVKVTNCPKTDGLTDEVTVVDVLSLRFKAKLAGARITTSEATSANATNRYIIFVFISLLSLLVVHVNVSDSASTGIAL